MTEHHIPNAAVLGGWRKSSYSGPNGDDCVEVLEAALLTGWRKSSYSGSDGGDCVEVLEAALLTDWRKSSYSGPNGDDCLEVLDTHPTAVPVRDSKNPSGPALVFPADGWTSFVTAVKHGELPTA